MLPAPGTRWTPEGREGVFTVRDVDLRRGVLLLGDDGSVVRAAAHDWPRGWVLVPGESEMEAGETERHPMRTFLVGGASGRHLDRIRGILAESGFALEQHVPGESGNRLPKPASDIEVIVVLVSHTGHALYWAAKEVGKARGLPVVLVESAGIREDLRTERARLRLGAWERMGAQEGPSEGWWTWDGETWVWTTPEPQVYAEDGVSPSGDALQADTGLSLAVVVVAVAAVFRSAV